MVEHELDTALEALRIIAGGLSSDNGGPDFMIMTRDEFHSAMWSWSQKIAREALSEIEGLSEESGQFGVGA